MIMILQDVIQYTLVYRYQCRREKYCHHLQNPFVN